MLPELPEQADHTPYTHRKRAAAAHCVSLNQAPPDCTPESGARAKAVFIVLSMPPGMQRFIAGRNSSGYNERNSSSGPL